MYHSGVATPSTDFAISQFDTGLTVLNHSVGTSIDIKEGNNRYATFKDYSLVIGNDEDPSGDTLRVVGNAQITQELTLKRGAGASAQTFTHLPFVGDQKNYIRGTTIIADNGGKVGIGGITSPAYELDVNGTTHTSKLIVGDDASSAQLSALQVLVQTVGPSTGRKVQFTVTGTFPSDYVVFATPLSASGTFDDNFSVTVMSKSTTQIVLSIYRTDANSGWGQNLQLQLLILGG
jgi:hypothetical protein